MEAIMRGLHSELKTPTYIRMEIQELQNIRNRKRTPKKYHEALDAEIARLEGDYREMTKTESAPIQNWLRK
jgi:hypothetical protein